MDKRPVIVWRQEVSLLTNFYLFKTVSFVTLVVVVVTYGAIFIGLIDTGLVREGDTIWPFLLKVALALLAMFFLLVWLLLGNRYAYEYRIDDQGVLATGIDSRSKLLTKIAVVSGLTSGKPLVGGKNMLQKNEDARFIPWSEVRKVDSDAFKAIVHVKRRYLDQIDLYCTARNFNEVLSRVQEELDIHKRG